jgi:hypothetical protein
MKKDDFEDYYIPIQHEELNNIILTLNNKYPQKGQYIKEIEKFLIKFI